MKLQLRYFASLRDTLGCAAETLQVPADITHTGELRDWLMLQPGRAALGQVKNLRCALNQDLSDFNAPLQEGDEVAFFPPVTGG